MVGTVQAIQIGATRSAGDRANFQTVPNSPPRGDSSPDRSRGEARIDLPSSVHEILERVLRWLAPLLPPPLMSP